MTATSRPSTAVTTASSWSGRRCGTAPTTPPSSHARTVPSSGSALPYPSTLTVAGVTGQVTNLRVRLDGMSHTYPSDLDIFLMAPDGSVCALMSDVGGSYDLENVELLHGPMLGCVTEASAKFWVRTAKEVPVQVLIGTPRAAKSPISSDIVTTAKEKDFTAVLTVRGLKPDTRYPYKLVVDGRIQPSASGETRRRAPLERA